MAITSPPRAPEHAPEPAPQRRRRLWLWLVPGAFVAAILLVVIAFMAMLGGGLPCFGGGGAGAGGPEASQTAVGEIPPKYLAIYRQVGSRYDIDWAFLASIGAQESGHGANAGVSSAGCIGVMQLCGGFTRPPIAQDGNGDGDIQLDGTLDIADSIASAANGLKRLKHAPGIGGSYADYRRAACGYYGACADGNANYADEVMARAVQYGFVGAGSPAPTNPSTGPTQRGPELTMLNLGDSLAVGVQGAPLTDALPGWSIDSVAQTNRPTSEGVARLEARASGSGDLPSVLVVSLGSNDDPTDRRGFRRNVERVLELAGPNRCVLWMEIRRPPLHGTGYTGLNRVLRRLERRSNSNLHVVDAVGQLSGDGVHLTPAGYRTRANAIGEAARGCMANLNPTTASVGTASPCGNAGGGLEGVGNPDAAALASNPNITWANQLQQLNDLRFGRISPLVIALISVVAERHKITVTALASDHAPGSNHEAGRAVDIAIVDGEACNSDAHGRSGKCWALAVELGQIRGLLAPTELIYGIDPDGPGPAFARGDHKDHVHVGFDGPLGPKHYDPDVSPSSPEAITGSRG